MTPKIIFILQRYIYVNIFCKKKSLNNFYMCPVGKGLLSCSKCFIHIYTWEPQFVGERRAVGGRGVRSRACPAQLSACSNTRDLNAVGSFVFK